MILKFNDGIEFDTDGDLRAESRRDGWYVVGRGLLIPVDDQHAAVIMIADLNRAHEKGATR